MTRLAMVNAVRRCEVFIVKNLLQPHRRESLDSAFGRSVACHNYTGGSPSFPLKPKSVFSLMTSFVNHLVGTGHKTGLAWATRRPLSVDYMRLVLRSSRGRSGGVKEPT